MAFEPCSSNSCSSKFLAGSGRGLGNLKSIACVLVCVVLASVSAHAQGVGTSGEIAGTVTDSSGGVVPRATVDVVDSQTGLKRTAITNGTGQFRVPGLPPAVYHARA